MQQSGFWGLWCSVPFTANCISAELCLSCLHPALSSNVSTPLPRQCILTATFCVQTFEILEQSWQCLKQPFRWPKKAKKIFLIHLSPSSSFTGWFSNVFLSQKSIMCNVRKTLIKKIIIKKAQLPYFLTCSFGEQVAGQIL